MMNGDSATLLNKNRKLEIFFDGLVNNTVFAKPAIEPRFTPGRHRLPPRDGGLLRLRVRRPGFRFDVLGPSYLVIFG